jgi:hypothetical protein
MLYTSSVLCKTVKHPTAGCMLGALAPCVVSTTQTWLKLPLGPYKFTSDNSDLRISIHGDKPTQPGILKIGGKGALTVKAVYALLLPANCGIFCGRAC